MGSGVTPVNESKQSVEDQCSDTIQAPVGVLLLQFTQVHTLAQFEVLVGAHEVIHEPFCTGGGEQDRFGHRDGAVGVSSWIGMHCLGVN